MLKTISKTSAIRFMSTLINFLIVVVLAKQFGSLVKGESTLLLTNISFILLFTNIVGGTSIIHVQKKIGVEKLIFPSYLWAILISLISYLIMLVFKLFEFKIILHTGILAILVAFNQVNSNVLLSSNQHDKYNFHFILNPTINLVLLLLFSITFKLFSIEAFIYASYTSNIITLIISTLWIKNNFIRLKINDILKEFNQIAYHGIGYQLLELLQLLNFRIYFYILNFYQNTVDLGFYSTGVSLLEVSWLLARSSFIVNYSNFSTLTNIELERKINSYIRMSVLFTLGYILLLYLIPTKIYLLVFGEYFQYLIYSVKWLIPGIIAYNVFICTQVYFLAKGKYGELILALTIGLILEILFCYILIDSYYFSGASIGASASFIFSAGLCYYLFKKQVKKH